MRNTNSKWNPCDIYQQIIETYTVLQNKEKKVQEYINKPSRKLTYPIQFPFCHA